ncbi:MAG TPA: APC family permease [Methylomirabilota bacterium]|jgi:amino acid transporter|nr:APC family permease [Methylomirabilota bacterium]
MEMSILKRLIVGAPMPLAQARHERLSKTVALAVFSSDAMSSVAYATEEILLILVLAGTAAAHLTVPIALAIAGLLVVVSVSYQQTIHAYPSGGGSYIVARANLGPTAGLVAAGALLIDYVLTVSVSVAAGVAALTSAVPWLLTHRVLLGVVFTAAIAYANLRGVRESGRVFAVPTYLFIVTFSVLVGTGLFRWLTGTLPAAAAASEAVAATQTLTWFLVLRAFASGCTALTGVEAISNGVPAFKHPEARNAAITMGWMAAVLGTLFIGVSVLASALGITPLADETVVSQVARRLFGDGFFYFLIQGSTTLILVLAANTSFADFPRLNSLLARDRYAPRQFRTLGDRLVFSNGILILAGLAAALIIVFGGDTHALIPLYAVGVFISFTLSQAGMVRHWLTDGGAGWRWRLGVNGVGALVTGAVTVVIAVTKFTHGAWIVVLLIPLLVLGFRAIYRHYDTVAHELSLEHLVEEPPVNNTVLVLVGDLHMGVVKALRYAQSLSPSPKAVYVELDPSATARLEERWSKGGCGVPMVVLASPYRSMLRPLLDYIGRIRERDANSVVTIVIPEFVPRRWWQHLLHNQTALLVKGALLFRRGVVVVDVPFHLHS